MMAKFKTWIYVLGGTAATLALLSWAFAPRPVDVEVAAVVRGHFEASVDEDAKTRLRERYMVSAPLAGLLARVTLREGDAVTAGTTVAMLTPALSPMLDERTLREQQARVQVTQARVSQVGARIERAQVTLLQATNDADRSAQLAGQGFVSPTRLEADRLAVLVARKELDAARQEGQVARHEVEQARAALILVRGGPSASHGFAVRAPIDGQVLRVAQASEGAVTLGAPLLELGETRDLEVVAELLTTDAMRTAPGRRVVIERWGGDTDLEGQVRRIEPAAFTKVSALGVEEQRVRVLIDITSPRERWRLLGDGFRVGVRLITTDVTQAVMVPVGAVFPQPAPLGGMAVFALRQGRARLVPVRIGARNGVHAWVEEGLAEGDTVIVYPAAAVREGARVAVRSVH
jgi:HlyD family secretion protein